MHECLRIVRLPQRANVPVERTRRTNALIAAAMDEKTVMRPFAKPFPAFEGLLIILRHKWQSLEPL